MSDRQVRIIISADVASAIRGMRDVEQGLGRVGRQGQQAGSQASSFGEKLKEGLGAAGVVGGIAGIAAGIGYVIKQGVSFQSAMNELGAVTGASASQMTTMSATARALGSDITIPGTSASDAAGAMLELAKGGLSAQDAMEATRGTLILAAAASVSGAEAAQMQAAALNTFGLSADHAGEVANVLANAANAASGEITDFSQGLAQSGTVAASFGWSLQETTAMLGLMANAGIKGSDAGTSLKTTLTAMLKPTEQQAAALQELGIKTHDANGNMITAQDLTTQLAAAKGRMSAADFTAAAATAFGTDAVRTALVAANAGTAGYDKMTTALGNVTGAQDVAAAKTKGVGGAFGELMSQVEDVALSLFDKFAPALEASLGFAAGLVAGIGDLVGFLGNVPGPVWAGVAAFAAFLLLRGPLNALFLQAIAGYQRMGVAVTGAAAAARAGVASFAAFGAVARGALAALGGPLGIALTVGAVALAFFAGRTDEAEASTSDFTGAVDENTGALTENAAQVAAKAAADSGAAQAYKDAGGNVADYTAALLGNAEKQKLVRDTLTEAATAAAANAAATNAAAGATTSYSGGLGDQAGAFTNATGALQMFEGDLGKVAAAQDKGKLTAEGMAGATDASGAAAAAAASPMDALKAATEAFGSAASLADVAVQFMAASIDAATGHAISAEQATRLNEAALRAIATTANNYEAAQDGVTAAAIRVREAQEKVDEVTKNLGKSQEDGGTTADDLTQANLDLAEANRNNEEATGKVVDATDAQFDANIKAQQSALALAASAYATAIANGNLTGAAAAVTTSVEASRGAFIRAQIAAGMEAQAAADLATKLFGIPGEVATNIVANDRASAVIDTVQRRLQTLNGQTSYVYVNTVSTASSTPATTAQGLVGTYEDGGIVHAAAGRIVRGRGTSMAADGRGPGLTWAEAATNKEYYLSMKNGMESRNRALAGAAVADLGGQAMWGRAGDVRAGSFSPQSSSVNVAAPNVTVYVDGNLMTADRVDVLIDGKLTQVEQRMVTMGAQS